MAGLTLPCHDCGQPVPVTATTAPVPGGGSVSVTVHSASYLLGYLEHIAATPYRGERRWSPPGGPSR